MAPRKASAQVSSSMSGKRVICMVVPSLIFRVSIAVAMAKKRVGPVTVCSDDLSEAMMRSVVGLSLKKMKMGCKAHNEQNLDDWPESRAKCWTALVPSSSYISYNML